MSKKSVELIMKGTGLGMNDAFMLHLELWIFVHGIASMIATSYLKLGERIGEPHGLRRL